MIRIVRLTNQIGFAINLFGFKVPFVFGWREWYWDPPGSAMQSVLKHRNHWLRKTPIEGAVCALSTLCIVPHSYWRRYKMWRTELNYSRLKALKITLGWY